MTITLYGIPNCGTVKKARDWLAGKHIEVRFHDFKKAGLDKSRLASWVKHFGWEKVLNRAGTSFRKLTDAQKEGLTEARAIALMLENPSLVKRPVLEADGKLLIGFKPEDYAAAFSKRA